MQKGEKVSLIDAEQYLEPPPDWTLLANSSCRLGKPFKSRNENGAGSIQRCFFEQEFRDPEKWKSTIVMEAQEHLKPTLVEQAFRCLLRQHAVLRFQLTQQGQTVEAALVTGDKSIAFRYVDLTGTPELAQVHFRYAGQFNSLAGLPDEILDQHEPDMPTRHDQ